jgi:hypothetical protein
MKKSLCINRSAITLDSLGNLLAGGTSSMLRLSQRWIRIVPMRINIIVNNNEDKDGVSLDHAKNQGEDVDTN